MAAFVVARTFFGIPIAISTSVSRLSARPHRRLFAEASLTAREKRREAEIARIKAHRDIKREVENRAHHFLSAIVSVPGSVRERCVLTHRMARVKVFMEKEGLENITVFRGRVRTGLVRLFPELEHRGLLRESDGFDLKVAGGDIIKGSDDLRKGMEKCQTLGTPVFVEVIPHNLPPPKPPLSPRVQQVSDKSLASATDPNEPLHMISFYKFEHIERPDVVSELLQKAWSRMGIKGRVYVAKEGINAQLSVPSVILQDFYDAMNGSWLERGDTILPSQVIGAFLNTDTVVFQKEEPFEKLNVRPRDQVLSDGLQEPLNWHNSGREIPPEEWHKILSEKPDDTIVLDCRNSYESDVGRFEGAQPLNTRTFKGTWEKLEERLQNEDRGKKILTYCTGGIRCVKVNAFLEQKMGFTNTGRLEGGIVSYARSLREGRLSESTFKGVNHVFDGRMGEVITEDLLHQCANCGQPCNTQTDCANVSCPRPFDVRMFVQCTACAAILKGACSEACRESMGAPDLSPENSTPAENVSSHQHFMRPLSENERYAELYSNLEDPLLQDLRMATEEQFTKRAHMLSSHTQALFLKLLVQTANASRVLEIGTFTGYATLAMARGLRTNGRIVTCEQDNDVADLAQEYFARDREHGGKIILHRGRGSELLQHMVDRQDPSYDVAFIDADKGGYQAYLRTLLETGLIRVGGLLIFDNVLFRGEVAEVAKSSHTDTAGTSVNIGKKGQQSMRTRSTARKLHSFNEYIKREKRVEQVILSFRDGLTVARRVE